MSVSLPIVVHGTALLSAKEGVAADKRSSVFPFEDVPQRSLACRITTRRYSPPVRARHPQPGKSEIESLEYAEHSLARDR